MSLSIFLAAVERPLLAYSLSSSIKVIEYHSELILLMLFRCYCDNDTAQQEPFLHRAISQISQSEIERFLACYHLLRSVSDEIE